MGKRATVSVLLFLLCLWPLRGQGWEGKQDNKAAENLAQMKDRDLCTEAQAICARAAIPGAGLAMEGLDYLATIRQAVQKKHGQAAPRWLTDAVTAVSKRTPQHCPHACGGKQGPKRPTPSAAAGESPPSQERERVP